MVGHGRAMEACLQVFREIHDGTWQEYSNLIVQKLFILYGPKLHDLSHIHNGEKFCKQSCLESDLKVN
jgi:hypothetical protein